MMRKKITYMRHIVVFVLTTIIFSMGIFIGNEIEDLRIQELTMQYQDRSLEYQNVVSEVNYMNHLIESAERRGENVSCELLQDVYINSLKYLDDSRIKLETYYENADETHEFDYEKLRDYYSSLQINYWVLADRTNQICEDGFHTILYFFNEEKECEDCKDQGIYLDYVKKKMKDDILVFALDADKEGPTNLLARTYDLENRQLPVLVIGEEVIGFSDSDQIFNVLCEQGIEQKYCS